MIQIAIASKSRSNLHMAASISTDEIGVGMPTHDTNASRWYFLYDGKRYGPYPTSKIVSYINCRKLDPSALVWTHGMSEWASANTRPEFVGLVPPPFANDLRATLQSQSALIPSDTRDRFAGFWKRLAAFIIDNTIVGVSTFVAGFTIGFTLGLGDASDEFIIVFAVISGILLRWAYFAGMESSPLQATLGKMALGIQVVDLSRSRISLVRATTRHLPWIIGIVVLSLAELLQNSFLVLQVSTVFLTIMFFVYIMVVFTPKKQGLHDIVAKCLVVNRS